MTETWLKNDFWPEPSSWTQVCSCSFVLSSLSTPSSRTKAPNQSSRSFDQAAQHPIFYPDIDSFETFVREAWVCSKRKWRYEDHWALEECNIIRCEFDKEPPLWSDVKGSVLWFERSQIFNHWSFHWPSLWKFHEIPASSHHKGSADIVPRPRQKEFLKKIISSSEPFHFSEVGPYFASCFFPTMKKYTSTCLGAVCRKCVDIA